MQQVGLALTVASIPLWQQLCLLDECHERVERALAHNTNQPPCSERDEMKLLSALGMAQLHIKGPRRSGSEDQHRFGGGSGSSPNNSAIPPTR